MEESFDPYYQWLGISPKQQPPNHYRLLGLELFEVHPDVISSAADQRMAHVRSFQSGQRGKVSQRVLNELSAARLCLLDPQKKSEYDATLRQQLAAASSTISQTAAPKTAENRSKRASTAAPAATAGDLLADLRAASRLTVLEAERLRLAQFELPAANLALGEHLFRAGNVHLELADQFDALDAWRRRAEAVDPAASAGKAPRDPVAKIKELAKAEKLGREIDNLFRTLGKEAFERLGAAAGPAEVVDPVEQLTSELARVDSELSELAKDRPGRVFNTRWLAIMGCTVLAAVLLLLLGVPFRYVLVLLIVGALAFAYRQFTGARSGKNAEQAGSATRH